MIQPRRCIMPEISWKHRCVQSILRQIVWIADATVVPADAPANAAKFAAYQR
jgi:hypothetical protein